jgi:hypothetical protein
VCLCSSCKTPQYIPVESTKAEKEIAVVASYFSLPFSKINEQ